jgi:hypothetical protein
MSSRVAPKFSGERYFSKPNPEMLSLPPPLTGLLERVWRHQHPPAKNHDRFFVLPRKTEQFGNRCA